MNANQDSSRVSRYDFQRTEDLGTLRDLIANLNAQHAKASGEPITPKSLKRTLVFISQAIGIEVASADQELPLSTLRTIKMFYVEDANSNSNVIRLLAPPSSSDGATMEFSTVTTIPRDRDASALIRSMVQILSIDIDPEKIKLFSRMLGDKKLHTTAEKLLLHAEHANDQVTHILTGELAGNHEKLARAYRTLSDLMDSIHIRRTDESTTAASESAFVYLETLAFRHFVQKYPRHAEEIRIKHDIGDFYEGASKLCALVSEDRHSELSPFDQQFTLNNFHHLVLGWPKEVTSLVKVATGFETTPRQLEDHIIRAKALLSSYAYRSLDSTDADASILSVCDIVAALCSFRYQQKVRTEYKPYWHGQVDQGKDPQRLFDKGLRKSDPHQHQGVLQIYLNRFYEFQAAFTGTTEVHQAWVQYQGSRTKAYLRIIQLNDIVAMVTGVMGINFLCLDKAKDIVIDHLHSIGKYLHHNPYAYGDGTNSPMAQKDD
ncbi:hypothetical protein [Luteimonas sp. A649]